MTYEVIVAPLAEQDLRRNADWWAENHSPTQAERWFENAYKQLSSLKSVVRSMLKLKLSLEKIQSNGLITQKDIAFQVGKLISPLEYVEFSDIEGDLEKFLEDTLSKIYLISDLIVKKYFT